MDKKITGSANAESKSKLKAFWTDFGRLHLKDILMMLYDMLAVTAAFFLALWLRFDCEFSEIPAGYLIPWLKFAPIYAILSIAVFQIFRLYQSIWQFASVEELKRVIYASVVLAVLHTTLITLCFARMPIS